MARFGEALPNSGVDDQAQWMMVPLRENVRFVLLKDGKGLTLDYARHRLEVKEITGPHQSAVDPNLTKLVQARNPSARLLTVTGLLYGLATIRAKDSRGITQATIDVAVKRKRILDVAFRLVKHNKGSTNATLSDIDKIVADVGYKLGTQANVFMRKQSARWVTFAFDTIYYVVPGKQSDVRSTWEEMVKEGDATADANVFLVDAFTTVIGQTTKAGSGLTVGKNVAITKRESADAYARTVAHEVIHVMGVDASAHRPEDKDHILGPIGTKIPKELANGINP